MQAGERMNGARWTSVRSIGVPPTPLAPSCTQQRRDGGSSCLDNVGAPMITGVPRLQRPQGLAVQSQAAPSPARRIQVITMAWMPLASAREHDGTVMAGLRDGGLARPGTAVPRQGPSLPVLGGRASSTIAVDRVL